MSPLTALFLCKEEIRHLLWQSTALTHSIPQSDSHCSQQSLKLNLEIHSFAQISLGCFSNSGAVKTVIQDFNITVLWEITRVTQTTLNLLLWFYWNIEWLSALQYKHSHWHTCVGDGVELQWVLMTSGTFLILNYLKKFFFQTSLLKKVEQVQRISYSTDIKSINYRTLIQAKENNQIQYEELKW